MSEYLTLVGRDEPRRGAGELVVTDDPIRVADNHWRAHGWETGEHFIAALSIYRADELIRVFDDVALRAHRLTRSRHEALAVVYFSRHGEMPLGVLSSRLLVHPTSVTSTVDALEQRGLVKRVSHPTDRRATLSRITPKGRRAMEQTCGIMAAGKCGLSALDEGAATRLFTLLEKVRADAGDIKRVDAPIDGRAPHVEDPVLTAERNWAAHGWAPGPYFRTSLSIYRTAELIRQSNDSALRPHRLTHARHEALALLYFSRDGEMPMGKLGERLLVHPTSVTSTVDTLERLGFVKRVPHPRDRRATLARITARGRRAVASSNDNMTETRYGLAVLSSAQAKRISSILSTVRRAA
jgi:DNA-binding MarR family transcriptional regulator